MRKIEFRPGEIKQLRYESIHHKHPIVRRRMQALLLKSQGLVHQEIAKIMDISGTTLREYLDLYLADGLVGLKELHYQGQRSQLDDHEAEIITAIEGQPASW